MTDGKTRGQVRTWVRRTLLGLVAVVLLLVVGKGVQLATLEGRTARAATEALEASRESGRATMAELSALVERDLGVPVTHSADGYTCRVDHADQGWLVDHYYQECVWTRIDYVQVDAAQLERLVADLGGAATRDDACPRLYPPFEDEGDQRFRYVPVRAHPAGASGRSCELPVLEEGRRGGDLRPSQHVVLEAVDPEQLDPSTSWVTVQKSERFFRKDLGCGFGVIFCTEPMGEPAMPDPPQG